MQIPHRRFRSHRGHTLVELVTAMVSSAMLLAGLGSVMLIADQVANAPLASSERLDASEALHEFSNDLRFATFFHERSVWVLDFVVADRNSDGTAERIRYEWSGVPGTPLFKTVNSGTPLPLLDSVQDFQCTVATSSETTALPTTTDTAESILLSNASVVSGSDRDITATSYSAQKISPAAFVGIPANAVSWNATKVDFYGRQEGSADETLLVQLRSAGDPAIRPTSVAVGQAAVPESTLSSSYGWNTAVFAGGVRSLAFHRNYALAWAGVGSGKAARFRPNDSAGSGVLESEDAGASWQFIPNRQMFYRLYGTYTTPGPTYNVTRNFATSVAVVLQAGDANSLVSTSVPLANRPELLSAYWRTDFDRSPTSDDVTRDGTTDWLMANSGTYSGGGGGVWLANGALESRAKNDFTSVTTIEASCRNISQGGKGAVLRINADRQSGNHAPLEVRVQQQADLSQTVSLYGKSDDATDVKLFERKNLSSDFVRLRITILPTPNVVNIAINEVDEGTYTYPIYAATNDDRFLTFLADTSNAEYDYVEMRIAE